MGKIRLGYLWTIFVDVLAVSGCLKFSLHILFFFCCWLSCADKWLQSIRNESVGSESDVSPFSPNQTLTLMQCWSTSFTSSIALRKSWKPAGPLLSMKCSSFITFTPSDFSRANYLHRGIHSSKLLLSLGQGSQPTHSE